MSAATSTPYVALNGARVTSGHVTVPYYGNWTAALTVAGTDSAPSTGAGVTIAMGQLSLVGTVYRSAPFAGERGSLIRGGYGGWQKTIPAKPYHFSGGVRASMVLGDAARECGERVKLAQDGILAQDFARIEDQAAATLRELAGTLWWMGVDGVTNVGPRTTAPITSEFTVLKYSGSLGQFQIATERPQDWLPGNTFQSQFVPALQTISSATFTVENDGKLRVDVLSVGEVDQ